MRLAVFMALLLGFAGRAAGAEAVYLDSAGVVRWRADDREVALFGANYCLPSASDYRAAGYVGSDRRKLIERDMAHFARMGWNGMRLTIWGDWENSDRDGNLIANDHLDLMDHLLFQAKQRGISMLFSPIHTHSALWPDGQDGEYIQGFSKHFPRDQMGRDPKAIAAQANYLRQILEHVNPHTGVALKDEPAIVFVELINEPWHHSDDHAGSVAYIDALVDAVRATGCRKILFHNLSQDFGMAQAIRDSKVDGFSFGWYPTALLARRTLTDNFLRWVDDYPPLDDSRLEGLPRIVYEFDSADMVSPVMYPAMVRTFRGAGAQLATMFAYDMLDTAPYNLGWQTHFLNLVHSPRKAVSAIIAAEAMRRLPRGQRHGPYPENRHFGPFGVAPESGGVAWMDAEDAFMNAGDHRAAPSRPGALRRVVGCGSSGVVEYEGTGAYFLDRVEEGVWRLEVYPDAVLVLDPFAQRLNHTTVSSRLLWSGWPMRVRLPDLGESFAVEPVNDGNTHRARAGGGRFDVRPGVFLLVREGRERPRTLPERVGAIGFAEFVCPPAPELPVQLVSHVPAERLAHDATTPWEVDVVSDALPDEVTLHVRPAPGSAWVSRPMTRTAAYRHRAGLELPPGEAAWYVTVRADDATTRFPADGHWTTTAFAARAPLALFVPSRDFSVLHHSSRDRRAADRPISLAAAADGAPARLRHAGAPGSQRIGWSVTERIQSRGVAVKAAAAVLVRSPAWPADARVTLVMIESDGTSWSARLAGDAGARELRVPLAELAPGGGSKLPVGYPGSWNVALPAAAGRGGDGDRLRIEDVQQMQLVFDGGEASAPVEIEEIALVFE